MYFNFHQMYRKGAESNSRRNFAVNLLFLYNNNDIGNKKVHWLRIFVQMCLSRFHKLIAGKYLEERREKRRREMRRVVLFFNYYKV